MMQVIKNAVLPPDKFCFWLQGFAELHKEPPTPEQWKEIKKHLDMVFDHAQPVFAGDNLNRHLVMESHLPELPIMIC